MVRFWLDNGNHVACKLADCSVDEWDTEGTKKRQREREASARGNLMPDG